MEVTCEHCSARLSIPDAKLPPNRRVAINCPKCKEKITVVTGTREEPGQDPPSPSPRPGQQEPQTAVSEPAGPDDAQYDQNDSVLDIFEEGKKLALVMGIEASQNETLKTAVQSLGYQCLQVKNSAEAVNKLRFHHFDLIVLADGFDGHRTARSPILTYLNRQSMSVRRRIFLALVGGAFKTTDNMMAYALSANVVVNEGDLDKLTVILKSAIAENEKFYKIFMDTMVEIGRA